MSLDENKIGEIVKRLKEARIHLGYNQKDFAQEMGVSNAVMCSIENGNIKDLGVSFVTKLFEKFGVNPIYLLSGEGEIIFDKDFFNMINTTKFSVNHEIVMDFLQAFFYCSTFQFSAMSHYHLELSKYGNVISKDISAALDKKKK